MAFGSNVSRYCKSKDETTYMNNDDYASSSPSFYVMNINLLQYLPRLMPHFHSTCSLCAFKFFKQLFLKVTAKQNNYSIHRHTIEYARLSKEGVRGNELHHAQYDPAITYLSIYCRPGEFLKTTYGEGSHTFIAT